jgi:hypothetical protein
MFELSDLDTSATGEVQERDALADREGTAGALLDSQPSPTGRGSIARPTKRSYCQTIVLYPGLSMILASVRRGGNRFSGFRRVAGAR